MEEQKESLREKEIGSEQGFYLGVDLHKRKSWLTGMDEKGKIHFSFEMVNSVEAWEKLLEHLPSGTKIAVEATWNWFWLLELIGERFEVTLSHPLRTKAIASAKLKNDKVDSRMLAHLLRTGLLPQAYIPPLKIRDLREFLRFRVSLVRLRTALANKIHALLAKNGITNPYSELFGKKSLRWLKQLQLREVYRRQLDAWLQLAERIGELLRITDQECRRLAEENGQAKLLQTIPGVGPFLALLIVAEIGEIERFPSADKLASYAGLCPTVRASGGRMKRGRLSKEGNSWLRWAATEAAVHLKKLSPYYRDYYNKVAFRRGSQIARVATARKFLHLVWHMLTEKKPYIEKGAGEHRIGSAPLRART